jgi:SAM-dependent methyltransferase
MEMEALEDRHWWFRGRRQLLWALLKRAGGTAPRPRILDAGCGTGRNLVEFAALGPVQGVDPAMESVVACRDRGLSGVVQGRVEELPFDEASFDLLLATDVLEHVHDDVEALRELRRVAAPGALLLLTVPAHPWLWSDHDVVVHHRRRYRRAELLERVRATGWDVVVTTWWNSFLLPLVVASRRLARRNGLDHDRAPARLDGPLGSVLGVEARLVSRGAPLPVGISLALACRPAQPDR